MKKLVYVLVLSCAVSVCFSQPEKIVVPNGHSLAIMQVVLDEQQKYLYSSEDEKIIMWDAATGRQLYTFPAGKLKAMAISHAGDKLIYSTDHELCCYSTLNGKKLWSVNYLNYHTGTLVFTPDDSRVLINDEKGIKWFNTLSGNSDFLNGHVFSNSFYALSYANQGNDFILWNDFGWQIRNVQTGEVKFKKAFEKEAIETWYLKQNGLIASAVNGEGITSITRFQNINTGALLKTVNASSGVNNLTLIPSVNDEKFLFFEGYDRTAKVQLYNGSDFRVEKSFGNFSPVKYQQVTQGYLLGKQNKVFLASYSDLSLRELASGKVTGLFKRTVAKLGFNVFSSMEYNAITGKLNIICDDSVLKRIDLIRMRADRSVDIKTNVENVAISSTGDTIVVMDYNKSYVKNIATGKMLKPDGKIRSTESDRDLYSISADGMYAYYPDRSEKNHDKNALYRWNLTTNTKEEIFRYNYIVNYQYSPDKKLLSATVKTDDIWKLIVVDLHAKKILFSKDISSAEHRLVQISFDGKSLLLAGNEEAIIYSIPGGNILSSVKSVHLFGNLTASGDLSMIVNGTTNGELIAYHLNGEKKYTIKAHNSGIRKVLFSPDNKIIYSVAQDQTIKIWQADTGRLLGTLFLFNDGNDYVFADEAGRFEGTTDGIRKLYFVKDRNVIPIELVYEKYYTPNLYQRLVNGEVFDPMPADDLKAAPTVTIAYAEKQRNLEVGDDIPAYTNTTGSAEITVTATAPDDQVDEIRVFHNGKIVTLTTRNLIVADDAKKETVRKYNLSLLPGNNTVRAIALNSQRTESTPDDILIRYQSPETTSNTTPVVSQDKTVTAKIDRQATLHLVVVGINSYKNPRMSLNYAMADATAVKEEVEKDATTILSTVKTHFVTDGAADKKGIITAMEAVKRNAQPRDVFIFYYAGHGVIAGDNQQFYLVPNDVTDLKHVDDALKSSGISAKELQQYAIDIPAQKQLFILDACQSAGAFSEMLKADGTQQRDIAVVARSTGTHWMAASGAQQFANEFATLGHGAFTYVLLKALQGEAKREKMITVNSVKDYMQTGVPELMKKYNGSQQTPASYGFGNDFPIEFIKE
ncbi:caspase family protein [Niabella aquatica]